MTGKALHIQTTDAEIPSGIIGIFPNASPTYSILYTKCLGLIFLRGGQTSHGAIVAREFGIPALIDPNASVIPNAIPVSMNGEMGTWEIQV